MTKKQKTMWQERERRLRLVMGWISAGMHDEAALLSLVMEEFNYDHRARAEKLIADARSVLSGANDLSDLRGGRPREVIRKIPVSEIAGISDLAHKLRFDMETRPGAYSHSRYEVSTLVSSIEAMAAKYLPPAF